MKKIKICAAAAALLVLLAVLTSCGKTDEVLYVYNWGEYLADGSYDTMDVLAGFEEYYEELTGRTMKVYLTTFDSNEDLYAKISGGTSRYDVIFPSDYMIDRLRNEELLLPVNIEEVCEEYGAECFYDHIGEDFRGLYYDPEDKYSVPYTYGRVGIIYNSTQVDEEDCTGWELLWNPKYAGKILQFNNSRDAFATAQ
ncbi:MAG: ABC transporter substrate-binding protein, partial [Firmicutes bacterium]|nr:ABC transporter substrate-binding protein [Bacillota bacterium]